MGEIEGALQTEGAILFAWTENGVGVVLGHQGEAVDIEVRECGPHLDDIFSCSITVKGPGVFVWEGHVRYYDDEVDFNGVFRAATTADFERFGITLGKAVPPKRKSPRIRDEYDPRDIAILGGDPSL